MLIPDVNLLIYGFRRELPAHNTTRAWWLEVLQGAEPVGLHPLVECAFLRLCTKALGPLPAAETDLTLDFLNELHRCPLVTSLHEGDTHRQILRQLCRRHNLAGDALTDAWLAALALEKDATLASADTGFSRFDGLRWINPLAVKH
jgi:toxin-antitoxin system PIN domain toxin